MDRHQETETTGIERRDRRSGPGDRRGTRSVATEGGAQKRFLVILNGRGMIAEGDDLAELEEAYTAAATTTTLPELLGSHRTGGALPPFARLSRCDHESETGKICIIDAEEAADSVKSYYSMGFVV